MYQNIEPLSERHKKAIIYAMKQIQNSELVQYVEKIILYGSCARRTENWNSDVDLCVILDPECEKVPGLSAKIHMLKGEISSGELYDVEADVKFLIGDEWKDDQSAFCRNIRKDGKILWQGI